MIEESVDSFTLRWKPYAAQVEVYPNVEGSPLLECGAAGCIFHVFNRSGPYSTTYGPYQVIINPTARWLKPAASGKQIEITDLSEMRASGLVLKRIDPFLVIDSHIPLVVACPDGIPDEVSLGDWLAFGSLRPIHGFVVPKVQKISYEGAGEI